MREINYSWYLIFVFLFLNCATNQNKIDVMRNESAVFKNVGFAMQNGNIFWSVQVDILNSNVTSIQMDEIFANLSSQEIKLNKNNVNIGLNTFFSEPLTKSEASWLIEAGNTRKYTRFTLTYTNGTTKDILVPLAFSEKSKNSLRMILLKSNPNYIIEKLTINDKQWVLSSRGKNDSTELKEFLTLEDNDLYNWNEMISIQNFFNQNLTPNIYVNNIKNRLINDCPETNFNILQRQDFVIYHWNHSGCRGYSAQGEVSKIFYHNGILQNIRYAYKNTISQENLKMWINTLDSYKESHTKGMTVSNPDTIKFAESHESN